MKKRGISLILLVITIIIIIIIASAVILNLNNNNPVNKARLANVQQTRDSLKSGINLYIGKIMVQENGNHYASTMILGKNDEVKKYQIIAGDFQSGTTNSAIIFGSKQVWQLDYTKVNSLVNIKLDIYDNNSRWYIDEWGNPYLVYDKLSNVATYLKDETGNVNASVRDFVVYLDQDIVFSENSSSNDNQNSGSNTNKQDANVTLSSTLGALKTSTASIEIPITNPNNLEVSAVSSDTSVATIDSFTNTKVVVKPLNKTGDVTITINIAGNDTYNSEQLEYNLSVWNETENMPVSFAKAFLTEDNISDYIGTAVDYHPTEDATGVYRILYLDKAGKYGDGENALYIKRDYDVSLIYTVNETSTPPASSTYSATDMGLFNPGWKTGDNNINENNEKYSAYLCTKSTSITGSEWSKYVDSSNGAVYAIGSPSIEMFIDAYNQCKESKQLDCKFVKSGTALQTGTASVNGYAVAPAYSKTSITDFGVASAINSLSEVPNNVFNSGNGTLYWLASPSCREAIRINTAYGTEARLGTDEYGSNKICPVVCLGN